MNLNKQKKNLR